MKHDNLKPLSPSMLLRYHVISLVQARLMSGYDLAQAVDEVAALEHPTAKGDLCRVSKRSVYRWVALHEQGGVAALQNRPRVQAAASKVLDEKLLTFLKTERGRDPEASIPELLRRAKERGVLGLNQKVDRSTAYRALVRMDVPTGRRKQVRGNDMRRFAFAHRMEMVLADGKHFRAGAKRLKRMAYFFIDDATRLGLHVVVGTSESADLFLPAFHAVLEAHGRMGVIYLDHGPGFVATALAEVCRRLKIALVFGKKKYPEGHGKIERFNQTVKADVLRNLAGRPDVDPDCSALQLRLSHWIRQTYNHTPHSSLERP
jgi:putative transposase